MEARHNHYMNYPFYPDCPCCKLNKAAPETKEQRDELLEVCKRSKTYLATLPGKYGIECRHLFAELKAIIAKCEKG